MMDRDELGRPIRSLAHLPVLLTLEGTKSQLHIDGGKLKGDIIQWLFEEVGDPWYDWVYSVTGNCYGVSWANRKAKAEFRFRTDAQAIHYRMVWC